MSTRCLALLTTLACAACLTPALAGAADAGPATDYRKVTGLSQPIYTASQIERTVVRLPAFDGVELYVEVVKPKGVDNLPVILEASPYHGTLADRDGTRILGYPKVNNKSVGLTGWFAPRGYAVVMFDLRGTGRSRGCLDHLAGNDAKDIKQVVEWAAAQPWSNGKVGMTGHSYVGSTPMAAAAMKPKGLATIVPSAGLAGMYDHQFQGGVPFMLQWAGPQWSYEGLAVDRKLHPAIGTRPQGGTTGDDTDENGLPNNPEDTGCGLPQSALVSGEDQLSGRYADWHAARDHRAGAAAADIPVFLVHGVNDNAARITAADWFLDRNSRAGDKAWIGQWDHGSPTTNPNAHPTYREMQFTYALTAWFDKHLKGLDVNTGPPAELFMTDTTFEASRGGARKWVVTRSGWPDAGTAKSYYPASNGTMAGQVPGAGLVGFSGTPQGHVTTNGTGGLFYATQALTERLVLAGLPKLRLSASVTVPRVHLIATIYDVYPAGDRRRISQCSINPELRAGLDVVTPVIPTTRYDLNPPCMAMAQNVEVGHKIGLRVTTSDPDKVPLFAVDPSINVYSGPGATKLDLPVLEDAVVRNDTMLLK